MSDAPFPIRELSRRTGVNTVTLRAWERRHGLLKPQRTEKGHRLYIADDVERVKEIQGWLVRGLAISQVRKVLESDEPVRLEANAIADRTWASDATELLSALETLDRSKVAAIIDEMTANYPAEIVADRLLTPVQIQLQRNQRHGTDLPFAFLQAMVIESVHTRQHSMRQDTTLPGVLLVNINAGEHHLMAEMLTYALLQKHIAVNYLGYLAPTSWPRAVEVLRPAAVVGYTDVAADLDRIQQNLPLWQRSLNVPFWLAGAACRLCMVLGHRPPQQALLGETHQLAVNNLQQRLDELR